LFGDYGSDLGSGPKVPGKSCCIHIFAKPWSHFYNLWLFWSLGDPAGARGKPGSGSGYGVGIRVDSPLGPLRLEYAFNDKQARRFHFGVGHRN
jgi:outer membrane protein insertion porin family